MNQLTDPDDAEQRQDGDSSNHEPNPTNRPRRQSQRRRSSRTGRRPLPTVEDIIRALHSLPQLVALGVLQSAEANSIRSALDSTLRALERRGSTNANGRTPPIERLREMLDSYPAGIDILESLLGNEVIDQLFEAIDPVDDDAERDSDDLDAETTVD
jgi:hypothetical protein